MNPLTRITGALAAGALALMSLAGCDDDYLYPVEYPVYDPDGGSDNGSCDEIPVPEKVNNKVVAHRGGSAEAGTAKYPDNSIASLSYAISLGCYASECDIYWTADNNVVVAHAANGCYVNNLKPWEHTLDELRAAGKLSNGELLPTLEEFIDVALHAGTTRLWLDVKRIEVGGATSNTAESVKACSRGDVFREIVTDIWMPALRNHAPEMIFISAGFDAHYEDDMGSLGLVEADYMWATEQLKKVAAEASNRRIVSMLEGGYSLSSLARSVVAHIKTLADL